MNRSDYQFITLESNDIKVILNSLGASIYKIYTPDKNGNVENIVLNFENKDSFTKKPSYFGSTCGRCAGRIKNASFKINNKEYLLSKNNINNHLHGGYNSLSTLIWDYSIIKNSDSQICVFSIKSPHLSEGYPANTDLQVIYTVSHNSLKIDFRGVVDQETFLNLTNHAYFNLSANQNNRIYNHNLYVNADKYVCLDSESLPMTSISVNNTYFDFRKIKKIGNLIENNYKDIKSEKGLNHPFILNSNECLTLEDTCSGRSLKIKTSYPAVILYSYNYPYENQNESHLNKKHIGLAIECQYVPNAMNSNEFYQPITSPIHPYYEWITYEFHKIDS